MANFEAFRWNFSMSTKPEIGRSARVESLGIKICNTDLNKSKLTFSCSTNFKSHKFSSYPRIFSPLALNAKKLL